MNVYYKPSTTLGKWSVWLIIGFIVLFAIFQILVALGQRGGDTFFSNLALSVPMSIAGISGISAFFTGIIGIIKYRDRSISIFISTTIGFLILLFILGEILFPH